MPDCKDYMLIIFLEHKFPRVSKYYTCNYIHRTRDNKAGNIQYVSLLL